MIPVEYYQLKKKEKGPSEIATLGYIQVPRRTNTAPEVAKRAVCRVNSP